MTDKDIIKALECCMDGTGRINCENCPLTNEYCRKELPRLSLILIRTLQAENERLQKHNTEYARKHYQDGRADATKEFAEKIYTEINEALAQNHKVKVERINKLIARGIKSNDEFCYEIDGKILALRGIGDFIQNLEKEMVGEE